MIAAGMEQMQTKECTKLLPTIEFNLNTSKPSSTKIMPFEFFSIKNLILDQKRNFLNVI